MTKHMTKRNWIIEKLEENEFDNFIVYEYYEEYKNEFNTNISEESYKRLVRQVLQQLDKGKERIKKEIESVESYKEYDRETIISYIQDFIDQTEKKCRIKDVVDKYHVPIGAIHKYVSDFTDISNNYFKDNLYHIKDDIQEEKLKAKIKLLEKENKHLKKNEASNEVILEALESVVKVYTPYKFKKSLFTSSKKNVQREAVAILSDWHLGENVNREQMHGVNEFNFDIAKQRIDKLFNLIIENGKLFETNTINLLIIGDMLSGSLHDLAETNDLGTVEGILKLADYLSQHIQNLSKYFKKIKGIGLVGNHPRFSMIPRYKNKQKENFEYILYEFIRRETEDFFDFIIPESPFLIHEINGFNFLSLHGDISRGGNGLNSIPGNLSRDISLLSGTLGQVNLSFDYVNIGHFHSSNLTKSFSGAEIIMNGSLIGANDFSLNALKKGEKASQTFYIVEESYGVRFIDFMKLN